MKRLLISTICAISTFSSIVSPLVSSFYETDGEYLGAITWMHSTGLTTFDTSDAFRPGDTVTRQEAAKFFAGYAAQLETPLVKQTGNNNCDFTDLENADSTLTPHIQSACQTGILKGAGGQFFPYEEMTKAQGLTVLVRILEGAQDETMTPRRAGYHSKARELGLTKERDVYALDQAITRYEIALLIRRAQQMKNSPENEPSEEQANELKDLLLQLGLAR